MKPAFLNFKPSELAEQMQNLGHPKFRAQQLCQWIFEKRCRRPEEMLNLPKAMRASLAETFDWAMPEIIDQLESSDGSTKLLLKNRLGLTMEAVILRYENRTSLCVSSQVGCKLACNFCQTGKLGFVRNLTKADILSQYWLAQEICQKENRRVSHVVFMGMGEPLDNYEHAVGAANAMIDDFGLSARHVTLSTSGIVPRIHSLSSDSRAALAVSLHAARDELRTKLMPINKRYPLAQLKEALVGYQRTPGRTITIEYILIKDENCGLREAKELVKFLHGLRAKVNLIPFNAHPGMPYQRPDAQDIRTFQKYLADRSYAAPVRYSKGLDVSAACGQLAAKNLASLGASPTRTSIVPSRVKAPQDEPRLTNV